MMAFRVSVVLIALLAVDLISGNDPEIMSSEECDEQHCNVLDAPQYSGVTEGNSDETRTEGSHPTMMVLPVIPNDSKQPSQSTERETTMPMVFVQRLEDDSDSDTKNQISQPTILLMPQAAEGDSNEGKNQEPKTQSAQDDEEESSSENKNDETQPTMMVVPVTRVDNPSESKNDVTQPTMMVVPVTRVDPSSEPKNDETQATMMMVPVIRDGGKGDKKDDATQPTMMVVPVIKIASNMLKKILSQEPAMMIVPTDVEDRNEKKRVEKEQEVVYVPMEDDKENEIDNQSETLEKKEAKAESEVIYPPVDVCKNNEIEVPEPLKNNHHTKKDLDCELKNNSLEEDIKIGVIKGGSSEEEDDTIRRRRKIRQNQKRAISNKLALQYLAILDKTMGFPYTTKTPSCINDQFCPWRQYTMATLAPNSFPSFYN